MPRPHRLLTALAFIAMAGCGPSEASSGFSSGGFTGVGTTFGSIGGTETDVGFSGATGGELSGSTGGELDDGGFFSSGTTGGSSPAQYCGVPDAGAILCSVYFADEDGGGTGYRPDGGESDAG